MNKNMLWDICEDCQQYYFYMPPLGESLGYTKHFMKMGFKCRITDSVRFKKNQNCLNREKWSILYEELRKLSVWISLLTKCKPSSSFFFTIPFLKKCNYQEKKRQWLTTLQSAQRITGLKVGLMSSKWGLG